MGLLAAPLAKPLISAGASILGGIFSKPKETSTRTNFVQLRDDALEAGFNPLTALRATGGGGNTTTTHGGLSSLEVLGNALQDGLGSFLSQDPIGDETRRLENKLLAAQLDNLTGKGFLNVPNVSTYQIEAEEGSEENPFPADIWIKGPGENAEAFRVPNPKVLADPGELASHYAIRSGNFGADVFTTDGEVTAPPVARQRRYRGSSMQTKNRLPKSPTKPAGSGGRKKSRKALKNATD